MKVDYTGIQHTLFEDYSVLMITLPPCHPEFNPTELVLRTLLRRLANTRARWNSITNKGLIDAIEAEMGNFTLNDAFNFSRTT